MEQNKLNVFITFATTHYFSAYFANGIYTLYRTAAAGYYFKIDFKVEN